MFTQTIVSHMLLCAPEATELSNHRETTKARPAKFVIVIGFHSCGYVFGHYKSLDYSNIKLTCVK